MEMCVASHTLDVTLHTTLKTICQSSSYFVQKTVLYMLANNHLKVVKNVPLSDNSTVLRIIKYTSRSIEYELINQTKVVTVLPCMLMNLVMLQVFQFCLHLRDTYTTVTLKRKSLCAYSNYRRWYFKYKLLKRQ
jgi:hypothetical protein